MPGGGRSFGPAIDLRAVSREWFDLVGVSVALDSQLADLPELVNRLHSPVWVRMSAAKMGV